MKFKMFYQIPYFERKPNRKSLSKTNYAPQKLQRWFTNESFVKFSANKK